MDSSWIPKPHHITKVHEMFFYIGILFIVVSFIPAGDIILDRHDSFMIGLGMFLIYGGTQISITYEDTYREIEQLVYPPLTPYDDPIYETVKVHDGKKQKYKLTLFGVVFYAVGAYLLWDGLSNII